MDSDYGFGLHLDLNCSIGLDLDCGFGLDLNENRLDLERIWLRIGIQFDLD